MVSYLETHFKTNAVFVDLSNASDGICNNNSKKYLDFDKFIAKLHTQKIFTGNTFASCDTILFNTGENHIIFVEFKDMNTISNDTELENWWKSKNKSIYLKITDSILGLGYYLKNNCSHNYDNFMGTSKSFFYVYKSNTYKSKIKNHLKYKFSRYDFLFKNIRTIETENFENFLTSNSL